MDLIRSKFDNDLNGTTKARNKISISGIRAGFNKLIGCKRHSLNYKVRLMDQFRFNALKILGYTLKETILDNHKKYQISQKRWYNIGRWYKIIRNNYPSIFSDLMKRYALSDFILTNFASTTAHDNQENKEDKTLECADANPRQVNLKKKSKKKCKKSKRKNML